MFTSFYTFYSIPTPIPIDYGPEEGFRMLTELPNGCLELNDREYTYSLCPFKSVHQKSIGSSNSDPGTCIGRWGRWLESDEYEKSYKVMYYENGQQCWNGPTRTTKVCFRNVLISNLLLFWLLKSSC